MMVDLLPDYPITSHLSKPIDFSSQGKILLRQAALIVRAEGERDFVPPDVDVGMVPCCFRQVSHSVDKFDRCREILELVGAGDGVVCYSPIRHGRKRRLDLSRSIFW